MAILIDQTKRVLVQGITGREGRARTTLMREFGTNVVAGCTPGKGGQDVEGVPVFDNVAEAMEASIASGGGGGPIDISVVFVPARLVKHAAIEAIEAGVKLIVLVPDRVPLWDAMAIAKCAKEHGANFTGPNTLGVISPGKGVLGMIGGRADSARQWFNTPGTGDLGTVGVISRSGGMTSSCGYYLSRAGVDLSTLVHVGGDSVIGLPIPHIAQMFQDDDETDAIVIFGEIGGSQEERLADLMASGKVTKPVIAYIGGKAAKEGTRFSHAGAIIEGGRGTHEGKVQALRDAGATVVEGFGDLPQATVEALAMLTKANETATT
ncbi:MAG: CoA-binding protein [Planctomycetota bacterium]|nr:CoA-binding protein [Planctomycetota bacterium]